MKINIKIKTGKAHEQLATLDKEIVKLSVNVWDAFMAEWDVLQKHGCELTDTGFTDGICYAWISDDFVQHCLKYGIKL